MEAELRDVAQVDRLGEVVPDHVPGVLGNLGEGEGGHGVALSLERHRAPNDAREEADGEDALPPGRGLRRPVPAPRRCLPGCRGGRQPQHRRRPARRRLGRRTVRLRVGELEEYVGVAGVLAPAVAYEVLAGQLAEMRLKVGSPQVAPEGVDRALGRDAPADAEGVAPLGGRQAEAVVPGSADIDHVVGPLADVAQAQAPGTAGLWLHRTGGWWRPVATRAELSLAPVLPAAVATLAADLPILQDVADVRLAVRARGAAPPGVVPILADLSAVEVLRVRRAAARAVGALLAALPAPVGVRPPWIGR